MLLEADYSHKTTTFKRFSQNAIPFPHITSFRLLPPFEQMAIVILVI